ncbi:hypothetical protein ZWY2020_042260 [Hordeum vulgare]|nr:hypothetical protein ZWY2020_042260 [Hordeum vulgare]
MEKAMGKARLATCVVAAALVVAALVAAVMATSGRAKSGTGGASTAHCNAGQLMVCAAAIIGGAAPSASCCSSLRVQQGCFCQYARNPAYGRYIGSPTAHRAIVACRVAVPSC